MELKIDLVEERRLYEAGIRPSIAIGLLLLSRLEQAEQQVARVREVLSEWDTDEDSKGLHFDIRRALDGDGLG